MANQQQRSPDPDRVSAFVRARRRLPGKDVLDKMWERDPAAFRALVSMDRLPPPELFKSVYSIVGGDDTGVALQVLRRFDNLKRDKKDFAQPYDTMVKSLGSLNWYMCMRLRGCDGAQLNAQNYILGFLAPEQTMRVLDATPRDPKPAAPAKAPVQAQAPAPAQAQVPSQAQAQVPAQAPAPAEQVGSSRRGRPHRQKRRNTEKKGAAVSGKSRASGGASSSLGSRKREARGV